MDAEVSLNSVQSDVSTTSLPPAEGTARFHELDALRGVAAFSVVCAHFCGLWDQSHLTTWMRVIYLGPLQLIKAGHAAVQLFFVLSGFVLSLPVLAGKPQPYGIFITRRITRVYLPYLAALLLAIVCDASFRRSIYIDDWFSRTWTGPVQLKTVLAHMLLFGLPHWSEFNTAFWSVIYELRISFVFPLLASVVLPLKRWMIWLVLAALFSLNLLLTRPPDAHTVFAVPAFVIGICCARYRLRLSAWIASLSSGAFALLSLIALILYAYSSYAAHLPGFLWVCAEPLTLLGATTLVIIVFSRPSVRISMQHRSMLWLGNVSYSMYLVHGTILFSLVHLANGRVPLIAILPIYVVVTLLMSRAFNGIVERPSMHLGRFLTTRSSIPSQMRSNIHAQ